MKWISYMYTYMYSFLDLPCNFLSHPVPLGHHRTLGWAPCAIQHVPIAIYFTHCSVYISILIAYFILFSSSPPVFYVCTSTPGLKIGSSAWCAATPWTVAHQACPSVGFSRQESWSGLPSPPPGDLPNPGIEPRTLALQADSLLSEPPGKPIPPSSLPTIFHLVAWMEKLIFVTL